MNLKTPLFIVLLTACSAAFGAAAETQSAPAEAVRATGNGAVVAPAPDVAAGGGPAGEKDSFAVTFPAGGERPAATFAFKDIDINDRLGMALDVKNTGREPVRVYADLNGDTWVRGYVLVEPGKPDTLYVFARRRKLAPADAEKFPGMHGIPGGKMSLWAGVEEPIVARQLVVFAVATKMKDAANIQVSHLRPFGSSALPDLDGFYPFIDKYGQYKHKDWRGKTHADDDLKASREKEDADLAAHPGAKDRDNYGGWAAGPQLKATGHFRTEKHEGKWWLVDPEGRLFWSHGLDCVGFSQSSTRTQGRERFYDDPAPRGDFLARNLQTKYGENWRDVAGDRLLQRVRSWGLNTLGGGADRSVAQKKKVPYTLQIGSAGFGRRIDPDSDEWRQSMRRALTAAAERTKDDPWCIGFFVDNEIHVSNDPAWWEKYYRQVGAVAKEVMPDKLYLGSRLDYHDWPDVIPERREIVRQAARYCDVVSFNFYKFTLDDVAMPEGVDKPIVVGEFHMGALDRGLFHTGLRSVRDQDQRAEGYRLYVTSALRNPAVVGAHWFQCYDESTTGRFDGENYQIGFLDICDTPYWETIAAVREVGEDLYAIRSGTGADADKSEAAAPAAPPPPPPFTSPADVYSGVSGPGKPVVGDGSGGWRSGPEGVLYKGPNPKPGWNTDWGHHATGSAVKQGLIPPIKPIRDLHLRDTVIRPGGDGNYYMTGSSGDNIWDRNDGVELWRSADLKGWDYLGSVWSIEKDGTWQKQWRQLHNKPARDVWAPELHYIRENYYLCLCMAPGNVSILKSKTGKPEGPYADALAEDKPLAGGIDPTLFEDEDGKVYFSYGGGGKIARMKGDLSGLAEPYHAVRVEWPDGGDQGPPDDRGRRRGSVAMEGVTLFKAGGKYYLGGAMFYQGRYSSVVAMADDVYGPYRNWHEAVPCGGGTNYFRDKQGNWFCCFFGNDDQSPWREKPGLIRIDFDAAGKIVVARDQPTFLLQDKPSGGH